jgi:pyruvate dehydrogenase E1 component alpha subunit
MLIEKFDPLKQEILRILEADGRINKGLEPPLSPADLRRIYDHMVTTRTADEKAIKLQRQGRMGTYAPSAGHEACQVGTAFSVQKEDWFFPYFRDLGMYITLGYPLSLYYSYWMGNEMGMRAPEALNIMPLAIPVASQIPQAVGAGLAANILKKKITVFSTLGDGATSEGDFHEALNFAGVFRTPNVFVCYNNQWAISTPVSRQTAAKTIAQKALAYGFPGIAVDGNDVLAVYAAVSEAAERSRAGLGPTLVEAVTYRMGLHTTSDDATKYRTEEEVKAWEQKDPIQRFRIYLKNKGLWDDNFEKDIRAKASEEVEKAVSEAESLPPASVADIFAFTYKTMTPRLTGQLAELEDFLKEAGR